MGLCRGVTVFCIFICIKVGSSERTIVNTVLNIWELHKRQGIYLACAIIKANRLVLIAYILLLLL
jgi:hypothetical protein